MIAVLIILFYLLAAHLTIGVGSGVLLCCCVGYVVLSCVFHFFDIP